MRPTRRGTIAEGGRRRSVSLRLLAIVGVVALAGTTAAAAQPVTGDDLRQLVNGKRIYLATPFGGEFPLHYRPDGTVSGDGSAFGLGRFMAPRETGRWWVDGANLCQKWPTWYEGRTTCFTIDRTGESTLRWVRDDGRSGRARIDG